MIPICVSIGGADFDRLFKVLSARFFHSKVTTFLFVINTYFMV